MTSTDLKDLQSRLDSLRATMKAQGVDVMVVRATDRFLNEYVGKDASARVWLTGFQGSMGDAVVTADQAILVVDGRYELQVKTEAPLFQGHVTSLGVSIEAGWLRVLSTLARGKVVGIETDKVSVSLMKTIERTSLSDGYKVRAVPGLVDALRTTHAPTVAKVFAVSSSLSGRSVAQRLQEGMATPLVVDGVTADGLLLCALDELAWVSNLRGDAFPYQATFPAVGIADATSLDVVTDVALPTVEAPVRVHKSLQSSIEARRKLLQREPVIAIDASTTPAAVLDVLRALQVKIVEAASPFAKMRTKKTPAELQHMIAAFAKADSVVDDVQKRVARALKKRQKITEATVAAWTEEGFRASGAWGLSFNVISAAGKNGAFIHYGSPNDQDALRAGDLFLLDTGAYYEGGYATDLTRTFLLGPSTQKASKQQKQLYTLVLKGAIAGMSARIPTTATGGQLDAMVRAPMWAAGYDYGHGTGHGVGVNVHESPPRISINSMVPLEVGQVFSIEPGVYLEGWGGIRIENLCTVVEEGIVKRKKGMPVYEGRRFLRVQPLTFSPLDERLIDRRMLTAHEKKFLAWFKRKNPRVLPPVAADV
jgi:Xaa-Pro aminopeptidase